MRTKLQTYFSFVFFQCNGEKLQVAGLMYYLSGLSRIMRKNNRYANLKMRFKKKVWKNLHGVTWKRHSKIDVVRNYEYNILE